MTKMKEEKTRRGFQSYKEGEVLHGRDVETRILSQSIISNLHTILYGQSGAGKTSLLQAGVFPVLRERDFFPVYVRLGRLDHDEDYQKYIYDSIMASAETLLPDRNKTVYHAALCSEEKLSDNFDLLLALQNTHFVDETGTTKIPVIILDQFEEILTNPEVSEKATAFIKAIYPMVDDSYDLSFPFLSFSNYRIVFSMREDYLCAFEDIIDTFNLFELKQNRFRLRFFNPAQARIVATQLLRDKIEEETIIDKCVDNILDICKNRDFYEGINTALLSLITEEIEISGTYDFQIYNERSLERIVYNYYDRTVSSGAVSFKTREFIEKNLVTSDGRRSSVDLKDALDKGNITNDELVALADKEKILSIQRVGSRSLLEFSHDILAKIIRKRRIHFRDALKTYFVKIFDFRGTATKEEFYISSVFFFLIAVLLSLVDLLLFNRLPHLMNDYSTFRVVNLRIVATEYALYFLIFIPYLSTLIRRLHAVGKSGWNLFLPFHALYWASKPDAIFPYYGRLSNTDPLEFFKDFRTPPIRKTINQNTYIAYHVYFLFFTIIFFVLIYCLSPFFLDTESLLNLAFANQRGESGHLWVTFFKACFGFDNPNWDSNLFFGMCLSFWTISLLISPIIWLCMRLPKMNMKRFWAFIPIVNIILGIYAFWPDAHFERHPHRLHVSE